MTVCFTRPDLRMPSVILTPLIRSMRARNGTLVVALIMARVQSTVSISFRFTVLVLVCERRAMSTEADVVIRT